MRTGIPNKRVPIDFRAICATERGAGMTDIDEKMRRISIIGLAPSQTLINHERMSVFFYVSNNVIAFGAK